MKPLLISMLALSVIGFSATANAQSDTDWFTCSVGTVCVEYNVSDAARKDAFIAQCANYQAGRACPASTGCMHRAQGAVSVTYGGDVSDDEFRRNCKAKNGTITN